MLANALDLFAPDQGGALWIGVLVTFLVFGDWARPWSRRNLSLAGLFILAPFLINVMRWEGDRLAFAFTAIFLITGSYAAWGVILAHRWRPIEWRTTIPNKGLWALLAALLVMNLAVTFGRPPDDAGFYSNLGANRWAETGVLPYGDPGLKGPDAPAYGAAATYGPLLYAAHVPFQWLLRTHRNDPSLDPGDPAYVRPPVAATQLTCFALYLLGLFALFMLVERRSGLPLALGCVAVYAASPYLVGLGSEGPVVTGLRFISHIAPVTVILLALLSIEKPVVAGVLLAVAAGILFYPIFLFPLWLGYYVWRREGAAFFTTGYALTGAAIALVVLAFTPSLGGEHPFSLLLESTFLHQEGTGLREYGSSSFGFWGTHPTLASILHSPLLGSTSLTKPTFIGFALFSLGAFFLARGRTVPQLAGLIAALCAAVQIWKSHAGGTYVEWYLPFLLIALFAQSTRPEAPEAEGSSSNFQFDRSATTTANADSP